jgi:hypothetical protein
VIVAALRIVIATIVMTAVIATTVAVISATIIAMIVAAMIVVTHDLAGHPFGQRAARNRAGGEGRTAGKQRGDENKGHWAFHLNLLSGSDSIHCGASIDGRS